ncbi:hypothetical protein CK203_101634 [Vitis vinifera]|uniref:Integrase catalytic domain-containing protein n=1 Tax=Vitis vinifera TaxID=29760 RepID=A0A438DZ36_VITVI|nr:hypothetical protein CK203_101634 [Vitis vinifera]
MLQWAIELSEYGIEYRPRLSMKGQVMADFVAEFPQQPARDKEPDKAEWWTLQVDGAPQSLGSRVELLLQSPTSEQLEQAIQLGFLTSNNEAEYKAIMSGLDLALALFISKLRIYSDSQLFVRHVEEEYEARDERVMQYLTKVRDTLQPLSEWTIEKVPRTDNVRSYLRCLDHSETQYVLVELHEGVYSNHPGGQSLAHRAHSQGYYWPTMKKDATTYVKKCDKCQSNWVEVEVYASIKDKDVTKFIWKNIICRFGIPQAIIADNGPQFDSIAFRNFCSELK